VTVWRGVGCVSGSDLTDSTNPFVPYVDASAKAGRSYVYRISGVNSAGMSPPSESMLIGPDGGALTDDKRAVVKKAAMAMALPSEVTAAAAKSP
jgi:hypothetical protein